MAGELPERIIPDPILYEDTPHAKQPLRVGHLLLFVVSHGSSFPHYLQWREPFTFLFNLCRHLRVTSGKDRSLEEWNAPQTPKQTCDMVDESAFGWRLRVIFFHEPGAKLLVLPRWILGPVLLFAFALFA
jgi:hypothetical protein